MSNQSFHNIFQSRNPIQLHGAIRSIHEALNGMDQQQVMQAREQVRAQVGYETELSPIVLDKQLVDYMNRATDQWARASRKLLRDVYSAASDRIYSTSPNLRNAIHTSDFYSKELMRWKIQNDFPWDYSISLDWQFRRVDHNYINIDVIEVNAGSVGGLERSAFIFQSMKNLWHHLPCFNMFVDGTEDIHSMMRLTDAHAKALGGAGVNFQENDQERIFGQNAQHAFRDWLIEHDLQIVSDWNADLLQFYNGFYHLKGQRITNFWLQYYPSAIDHSTEAYCALTDIYKTAYEKGHHIPLFWSRYIAYSGYKHWHVFNPLGVEILCDKGLLAFFDEIIRLYLDEEPLISIPTYELFLNDNGDADEALIDEVFANRDDWVIKSRRDNREGLGVYVGRNMPDDALANGVSWSELQCRVRSRPFEYVCQRYLEDAIIQIADGRRRAFEVRNIAWLYGEAVSHLKVPYVRSGAIGQLRNLSRKDSASIIPVVALKESVSCDSRQL